MHSLSKIAAFAVCATLLTGAAAQASGRYETTNQVVSYADLNLANLRGMERLKIRLKEAASKVCGAEPDMRDLTAREAHRSCKKKAFDDALASVIAQMAPVQKERFAQGQ